MNNCSKTSNSPEYVERFPLCAKNKLQSNMSDDSRMSNAQRYLLQKSKGLEIRPLTLSQGNYLSPCLLFSYLVNKNNPND